MSRFGRKHVKMVSTEEQRGLGDGSALKSVCYSIEDWDSIPSIYTAAQSPLTPVPGNPISFYGLCGLLLTELKVHLFIELTKRERGSSSWPTPTVRTEYLRLVILK